MKKIMLWFIVFVLLVSSVVAAPELKQYNPTPLDTGSCAAFSFYSGWHAGQIFQANESYNIDIIEMAIKEVGNAGGDAVAHLLSVNPATDTPQAAPVLATYTNKTPAEIGGTAAWYNFTFVSGENNVTAGHNYTIALTNAQGGGGNYYILCDENPGNAQGFISYNTSASWQLGYKARDSWYKIYTNSTPPAVGNFTVIAQSYSGFQQKKFNVSLVTGGSTYTANSSTGTATTGLLLNDTRLFNITIVAEYENTSLNLYYPDVNITSALTFNYSLLQLNLTDGFSGLPLSSFSANLETLSTTTSTGSIYFFLSPGNHSGDMVSLGYNVVNITNLDINYSFNNLTKVTYPKNSVQLFFYNLSNVQLLDNYTKTIDITGTNFTQQNVTNATNILLSDFNPGVYTFTISTADFSNAVYIVTVGNNTFQSVDVYLEDDGTSTEVFTMRNFITAVVIEGAVVDIRKLVNGSYTLINSLTSDISGSVQFTYDDNGNYKFTVSATNYTTKTFILNPIIFNSYTVRLHPTEVLEDESDYSGLNIVLSPSIYLNNAQNNITFTISSPSGELVLYGFNATFTGDGNFTSIYGTNAYGEILTSTVNVTNALNYDKVVFKYYYLSSGGVRKDYTRIYNIQNTAGNQSTFFSNADNPYNIDLFDRIMIMVIMTLGASGVAFYFGGLLAGGLIASLFFGYFIAISFVPAWLGLIPILVIFAMLLGRGTL